MIPTPIGAVVLLIGVWLLFRPAVESLVFVLFCSLFAGASALDAVALGHSSIPPNMLALAFLLLRLCRRDVRASAAVKPALKQNAWLIVFCVYGALSAVVLPRIFAGRFMVMSMQNAKVLTPLAPSSQNLTQGLYLLGTAAAAVAGSVIAARREAAGVLVKAFLVVTWVHILTGLVDAAASAAHLPNVFAFVRNGAYAQLDQSVADYHRISGMTPEPSAYASLGVLFLAFTTELWLRNVATWWTGLTAFAMTAMLLLVTSSSGYVFLLAYASVLFGRFVATPAALGWRKGGALALVLAGAATAAMAVVITSPSLSRQISDILSTMTVGKAQSTSGVERGMWARQGWDLFLQTRGLGVGVGSFRSSNFVTAVLGSVGPACLLILMIYYLQVLKPSRGSTFGRTGDRPTDVGAAAAWPPILGLVPSFFGAPSADPGVLIALFCGVALTLRSSATLTRRIAARPSPTAEIAPSRRSLQPQA